MKDFSIAVQDVGIPQFMRDLSAVVIAVLDGKGELNDANLGFLKLIEHEHLPKGEDVSNYFLQPPFSDFAGSEDGFVYRGIFNIGLNPKASTSVNGALYRQGDQLLLAAEHDVADMERLNDTVLELNREMAQIQRDLVKTNRQLERSRDEIQRLSLTDQLTGLPNRRHFDERFDLEAARFRRYGRPLTVAMADIDYFKQVNDSHGHDVGDVVLKYFASVLSTQIREVDFAARCGGEEFMVLLPKTDVAMACMVLDRMRLAFSSEIIPPLSEVKSVSIGVTAMLADDTVESAIKRADRALYEAKEGGRNKIVTLL